MTNIFVNLPTSDLERAKSFYSALGASLNPTFTDGNAACFMWDDNIFFMLVTREFFETLAEKPISDPRTSAQVLIAVGLDSREHVDRLVDAGVAAGGTEPGTAQDLGFMYTRDLFDPDGNGVEFFFMEPEAADKGTEAYLAEQQA